MGILFIFRYCKNAQNQIFQHSNERKCILAEFRFWNERLEDERWWRHWSDPCPGPTAESVQRGSPVEIDRDSEIDEKTIQLLKVKILLKRERACVNASRRQRCRRRRRLSKTHKT